MLTILRSPSSESPIACWMSTRTACTLMRELDDVVAHAVMESRTANMTDFMRAPWALFANRRVLECLMRKHTQSSVLRHRCDRLGTSSALGPPRSDRIDQRHELHPERRERVVDAERISGVCGSRHDSGRLE